MRSIIDSEKNGRTAFKHPEILWFILLALYAAIHIYLIQYHEAWRDEAQAWTIAKNTSLREMFSLLSVEGHPALWFLFLRLFAKLGFPYPYISYLSLALVTAALALLLFKAPFPAAAKILLSLGAVFPEQKNIFLLLSDKDSSGDIADSYEMTAETPPGSLADENFRLFKIR